MKFFLFLSEDSSSDTVTGAKKPTCIDLGSESKFAKAKDLDQAIDIVGLDYEQLSGYTVIEFTVEGSVEHYLEIPSDPELEITSTEL